MKYLATILLALTLFVMHSNANALPFYFGKHDKIVPLVNIDIKDEEGNALYLAHRMTTQYFIAGVYVEDNGYVIGIKDKMAYYELNKADIATHQMGGVLPNPLPKYTISMDDYLIGYSLWVVLLGFVIYGIVQFRRAKKGIADNVDQSIEENRRINV